MVDIPGDMLFTKVGFGVVGMTRLSVFVKTLFHVKLDDL